MHVENGIVQSFYELTENSLRQKNSYHHNGHIIALNGKTYLFYIMIEDNTCLREFLNVEEAADNHLFVNKEFALDAQNDIYRYDL